MSFTVVEAAESRTCEYNTKGLKMRRVYHVISSSVTNIDGPAAMTALGIPLRGQSYDTGVTNFPLAQCVNLTDERTGPGIYKVTAYFETPDNEKNSQNSFDHPQLEIPEITMGEWEEQLPALATDPGDPNPEAFTNVCGEIFDPCPTRKVVYPTLEIARNELITSLAPSLGVQYAATTNKDPFWYNTPAEMVLCTGITCKRMSKTLSNGLFLPYLRVTYKFQFKYPDWQLRFLECGSFHFPTEGQTQIPFPNAKIGLLTAGGLKLPADEPPVYTTKRVYRRMPFSVLLLPQTMIQ